MVLVADPKVWNPRGYCGKNPQKRNSKSLVQGCYV